jgi:hypothetical protein
VLPFKKDFTISLLYEVSCFCGILMHGDYLSFFFTLENMRTFSAMKFIYFQTIPQKDTLKDNEVQQAFSI